MNQKKLVMGTRASKLALWQADHVRAQLALRWGCQAEIKKITTKGDLIQDRSLSQIGGKGLFLKEIEDELLSGTIDFAVHSMKDVPYDMPENLELAAILKRADPSDALVSRNNIPIQALPKGAVIGTSSLRRMVQLKNKFPHLVFKDLRGNVDTRLKKLDDGLYDAVVLASAGLMRLGLSDRISQRLDIVSSVGQGAMGIECCSGRPDLVRLLQGIEDNATAAAVHLERCYSRMIKGTCQTPMGCLVRADTADSQRFVLKCFKANPDGSDYFEKEISGAWCDGEKLVKEMLGVC
ncbi:MAG: hydroxymethylbilane synthase [Deltaproteobacteria bacterium]|nr:hydroxymethylbilane synthase [Deltaproteobacteria bacterium]